VPVTRNGAVPLISPAVTRKAAGNGIAHGGALDDTIRSIAVTVVVPPRALLLDIAGPLEVLHQANRHQARLRFDLKYVGPRATVTSSIGLRISHIGRLPARLADSSWVVVAGDIDEVAQAPEGDHAAIAMDQLSVVSWLRRAVRPTHKLITICTGALYAGRAGLLDGLACTTHYQNCTDLARIAPTARVLQDRLFVEDQGRYTSAGITAGIDLMLHVLHQEVGRDCAIAVARYMIVYLRRNGTASQFSPWLEGRNHLHPAVHRVQDIIAADLSKSWRLAELAKLAGASSRHLARLFQDHAGMTVLDYETRLRVAHARQLLQETRLNMDRVAEQSGFNSVRQLHRAWRKHSASPPSAARRPAIR
jgi:transcriptional regulator GlxA family with amidase domain